MSSLRRSFLYRMKPIINALHSRRIARGKRAWPTLSDSLFRWYEVFAWWTITRLRKENRAWRSRIACVRAVLSHRAKRDSIVSELISHIIYRQERQKKRASDYANHYLPLGILRDDRARTSRSNKRVSVEASWSYYVVRREISFKFERTKTEMWRSLWRQVTRSSVTRSTSGQEKYLRMR